VARVRDDREVDVLVAGGGPVGLFTALWLAERGLRVHIVDQHRRAALHSYALALHAHTLNLLDEVGLAPALLDRGQIVNRLVLHPWEVTLDLAPPRGAHPYVLVLSQRVLEAALEQRLADGGVQVSWKHQLLVFTATRGGVDVLVAGRDAAEDLCTETWRARYLVGADGYHSLTRRLLGAEQDLAGAEISLGLLEFETELADPQAMALAFGAETTDVLWPLGPTRARWGVELGSQAAEQGPSPDSIKRIVRTRAPWFDGRFGAVEWCTSVRFQPYLARSWGRGPVWLAGDAAHFTSPLAAQSLNVGLREAYDLARRLATILTERGSPKLLRYYKEERQREWKMLLGLKDRLRFGKGAPKWLAPIATRLVRSLPATRQDLNALLDQLGLHLDWLRGSDARAARAAKLEQA
jgi:2-polyprenyl-6-methoxyphenol hydroxylase-like FAD-dependent oxidoreductase